MKINTVVHQLLLNSLVVAVSATTTSPHAVGQDILAKHEESQLLSFHRRFVEIESITGNEHAAGVFLVKYLRAQNLTVDVQRVSAGFSIHANSQDLSDNEHDRFNIHAYVGKHRSTHTLVTSHYDTVPPFWPYHRTDHGREIWGRGSVDAKGAVAAQITAFNELRSHGKIGDADVGLLFVVGEETGGDGMRTANALNLTWDAVVFGEPTEGKLAAGHKGMVGFTIKAKGKAAHSGYPWLGQSANSIIIPALTALEGLKGKLPQSKKYGETTLNIGRIEGGVAANVMAETAEARVAIRLAGGTAADVKAMVLGAINNATKDVLGEYGSLEVEFAGEGYGPVDVDHDIDGFETITVNYGTDV